MAVQAIAANGIVGPEGAQMSRWEMAPQMATEVGLAAGLSPRGGKR